MTMKYIFKIQHIFLWPVFQFLLLFMLIVYFGIIQSIFQIIFGLIAAFFLEGFCFSICRHRYFAHNSFKTSRLFQFIMGFLGTIANQGSILWWSSIHNRHHKYCDQPLDPHSWSQTNIIYAWFGFWLYEYGDKLKYLPNNFKKNELLILNQYPLFILFIFSIFLVNISSISTLIYCYWLPSVFTTIATHRFNLAYHPKFNKNECKASDNQGKALRVAEIMGEGFHKDHHKYINRSKRPGIDLPYHLFIRPLSYFNIIWDLKNKFSVTNR